MSLPPTTHWPEGAIPLKWVESLFKRMAATYGTLLADQWRGQDTARIKFQWGIELGKVTADELVHGVSQLAARKWPPTLPEFVTMCRPPSAASMLPSHTPVPPAAPSKAATPSGRARELLGHFKQGGIKSADIVAGDGREWARRIMARRDRGEVMYLAQIEEAEKVLGAR
jgi:hypothetical protein